MEGLTTPADLAAACDNDPHLVWTGQGLPVRGRAWVAGRAVAVACPALSGRDRLAVGGPAEAVAPLVRAVAPIIGGTYILVGDAELVSSVTASVADLRPRNQFGWMDLDTIPTRRDHCHDHRAVGWLHGTQWPAVRDLLDGAFPDSYARPGAPGVRRWAGAYDDAGSLVATAADAWSAPTLGFLAGVCVHASARHRGLGRAVCRFVLADLVATHGRAGLMVHTWNTAAIRTYRDLGLSWRLLGTAWIGGDGSSGTPTPGGGQGHDC